ncbi:MAG: cold-shock protein [Candidatus Latescibacterota bacterium]
MTLVFVHDSSVENGDLLEEGNEVEFAIAQGPQGPMAVNVVEI